MPFIRQPKKSKPWPNYIACISAVRDHQGDLAAWGACHLDVDGLPCESIWGTDPADSVRHAISLCPFPLSETLFLVQEAYATLTSMGFWESLRLGEIKLSGVDERQGGGPRVICESPPTIIHFGVAGKGGRGVICDPRNWGYDLADSRAGKDLSKRMNESCTESEMVENLYSRLCELCYFATQYGKLLERMGDCGIWRCTAGSQASYSFRRNLADEKIECVDGSDDESSFPLALYGGRCECGFIGEVEGPVYQLDANQLYSYVASQTDSPVEYIGPVELPQSVAKMPALAHCCIASVAIKTDLPLYPYRPHYDDSRYGSELTIWPIGEFDTVLAGPELAAAVELGHVKHVYYANKYRMAPILGKWAKDMWALRQQAPEGMGRVVKGVALSLYGKFGQRQREWRANREDIAPEGVEVGDWFTQVGEGPPVRHRVLDSMCMTEEVSGYAPQSWPPIAAWVSSWARVTLSTWLLRVTNPYYWDTDSIWVGQRGLKDLRDNGLIHDGLGGLRLLAEYESVIFRGIKSYRVEALEVKAGLPHDATHVGNGRWQWERQTTFNSHMAFRRYPTESWVKHSARWGNVYLHGVQDLSGWVRPHCLNLREPLTPFCE